MQKARLIEISIPRKHILLQTILFVEYISVHRNLCLQITLFIDSNFLYQHRYDYLHKPLSQKPRFPETLVHRKHLHHIGHFNHTHNKLNSSSQNTKHGIYLFICLLYIVTATIVLFPKKHTSVFIPQTTHVYFVQTKNRIIIKTREIYIVLDFRSKYRSLVRKLCPYIKCG